MTVVGSPFWMAPEMMNGKSYTNKVDVFAFGIILCEMLGRVSADPDFLPRAKDFSVNWSAFAGMVSNNCPRRLWELAQQACDMAPEARPEFSALARDMEDLCEQNLAALPVLKPAREITLSASTSTDC